MHDYDQDDHDDDQRDDDTEGMNGRNEREGYEPSCIALVRAEGRKGMEKRNTRIKVGNKGDEKCSK